MKIAYVITRADAVGGASIHVRDLARAMADHGHQVLVFVGGEGRVNEQLAAAGLDSRVLRHLRRRLDPLDDWLAWRELTGELRDFAPDLVSTHTAKAGWLGRAAASRLGIPAIYTPHGLAVGERLSKLSGRIFTVAERAAAPWCARIVCVCEAEKRLAIDKGIASAEKIAVIYNGVRDIPDELHARPELMPVRICSVARFEAPKDHATLIQALARLKDRTWVLDLVGDGPLETEVKQLTAMLGIAERVRFLGYQHEPSSVLAKAHLFVLASRSEAFPRSTLEAMRAGLPIIASDVGGVSEAVSHGETGLLVPPRDAGALASAIGELLAAHALRCEYGKQGRAVYERKFRLEHTVKNTMDLYTSVLNQK